MTPSQTQVDIYVQNPNRCLFCGSGDITAYGLDPQDDGSCHQNVICNACEKQWTDVLKVVAVITETEEE